MINGGVDIADPWLDRHPTAGAQYHWSYFLAPRGRRFISFFQGECEASRLHPIIHFLSFIVEC